MGRKFGDKKNPLLVSVRSGAKISMPGMMDTVLNLGLNDETVQGLIKSTENSRFVWDAYRRFIQMFSNVVLGMDMEPFEEILETEKDLEKVVKKFKAHVEKMRGKPFPENPSEQLKMAINAVFDSWNTPPGHQLQNYSPNCP